MWGMEVFARKHFTIEFPCSRSMGHVDEVFRVLLSSRDMMMMIMKSLMFYGVSEMIC
jgi:hypothetical protein